MDMYRDISESQREIEEERSRKRSAYGRKMDQLGSLEILGLNEQEALDYVLMLSRDEEERRNTSSENPPTPPSFTQTHLLPSSSNIKVQASPRSKRETWSAGVTKSSGSPEMARSMSTGSDLSDEKEFPAVNESASPRESGVGGIVTPVKSQRSSGSPPSAWGTPLKVSPRPGTASPERVKTMVSMSHSTSTSVTRRGARESRTTAYESQEDRDLKLAIELSLAEVAKK